MSSEQQRWLVKWGFAIQAILDIQSYIQGLTQEEFYDDLMRVRAVERNLEILGEATNDIPDEIKSQYPAIVWHHIYGLRNVLAHGYDFVNTDTLWDTVTHDLDIVQTALMAIKNEY